jgi:hypothetical protein
MCAALWQRGAPWLFIWHPPTAPRSFVKAGETLRP